MAENDPCLALLVYSLERAMDMMPPDVETLAVMDFSGELRQYSTFDGKRNPPHPPESLPLTPPKLNESATPSSVYLLDLID